MVAAAAHAFVFGRKVAGVHDHTARQDLQIAVETRGGRLQGYDGDRSAKFSGVIPELYDAGDDASVSIEIEGTTAQGYDRRSSSHYSLTVTNEVVQLYDHAAEAWFAFTIQVV
jgi:N-acetyl-anhydromuramyl-L-alanine amidase AmpD